MVSNLTSELIASNMVSPDPFTNTMIGFLLGLLLVMLFAVIWADARKDLVRESIFNPAAFKVRQDDYLRNLKRL